MKQAKWILLVAFGSQIIACISLPFVPGHHFNVWESYAWPVSSMIFTLGWYSAIKVYRGRYWHPGIRLRLSTQNGVIVDTTSEHLYFSAKYGSGDLLPCKPECLPGCEHGWLNLVAGGYDQLGLPVPAEEYSTVPLKIEIKPLQIDVSPAARR